MAAFSHDAIRNIFFRRFVRLVSLTRALSVGQPRTRWLDDWRRTCRNWSWVLALRSLPLDAIGNSLVLSLAPSLPRGKMHE